MKFVYIPGIVSLVFLALAFLYPLATIIFGFSFLVFLYFLYARYTFSPSGRDVQDKIWELVLSNLDWNGEGQALDIGCGNAPLTIKLARKYPEARIIGIDFGGEKWDYSKGICERNAKLEGVEDRVLFQKASAAKLPFADEYFDAVVSNLTFHEVRDARDKREVIREAFRVIKKGGRFVFQDLFLLKPTYGEIDELITTIQSWEIKKVEFIRTCEAPFIPPLLRLPFMVGTMGILFGEK